MLEEKKEARGRKPLPAPNTKRFQAVLNRRYFREIDAINVAETLMEENAEKWTMRYILTESLIALGEKLQDGWKPQAVPSTITIGADVARMLAQTQAAIEMLSKMDITALRQVQGFDEQAYKIATTGASKLISGDTKFEGDDW